MSLAAKRTSDCDYIAFLVNFFEPVISLPVEIVPGLILRKATADELEVFQPYDAAAHLDRVDIGITRTTISLDSDRVKTERNDDFRGYVFEFTLRQWARSGPYSTYDLLELACSISESGLRPVLVCAVKPELEPYFFTHNLHRHTVLRRRALGKFVKEIPKFTSADLEEIRAITTSLKGLDSQHGFVFEAIKRFKHVEIISLESDFHTFGLFTIVEYLLTHSPRNEDDSLTKQMRRKCPTVTATFDNDVPIEKFFETMVADKAWKILYGYRSAIAHGGPIDFAKANGQGGFRALRSRGAIEAFLHLFTQRLLKCAVRDPERIRALKKN